MKFCGILILLIVVAGGCASFPISDRTGDYGRDIFITPGSTHTLAFESADMSRLSGDHKEYLDSVASYLARNSHRAARITGYSEMLETREETRRNKTDAAKMVMHYLMDRGIPGGRLYFRAGMQQPGKEENPGKDAPPPNRVEILILRN
jgi:outer membrane protein OmpA-like peptidoglycan-associated protein